MLVSSLAQFNTKQGLLNNNSSDQGDEFSHSKARSDNGVLESKYVGYKYKERRQVYGKLRMGYQRLGWEPGAWLWVWRRSKRWMELGTNNMNYSEENFCVSDVRTASFTSEYLEDNW